MTSKSDLAAVPTCELVEELRRREGVETTIAEPYEDVAVSVNGPAIVIDAAVLFGANKPDSWPTALVEDALAKGKVVVEGTGVDVAADISELMSLVEADGFDVTGFASDVAFRGGLRNLRDTNNQPIYNPSLVSGTPDRLYGLPIQQVRNGRWESSLARVLGGDWSQAVYSIRQDITFTIATEATIDNGDGSTLNLFQQDSIALRAVMRLGWQVANPITQVNQSHSRYPFAVLTR